MGISGAEGISPCPNEATLSEILFRDVVATRWPRLLKRANRITEHGVAVTQRHILRDLDAGRAAGRVWPQCPN